MIETIGLIIMNIFNVDFIHVAKKKDIEDYTTFGQ